MTSYYAPSLKKIGKHFSSPFQLYNFLCCKIKTAHLNTTHKIIISHFRAQAVMSKDSMVGGEIRVRGYGRSLSPGHSQKIARGHNI